jgi:putative transposase
MPEYRRSHIEGATYFFTVVTYESRQILTTTESRALLRSAWLDVTQRFPFKTIAICLLPEHIHCIWSLPQGDANYSIRWKEIKRYNPIDYIHYNPVKHGFVNQVVEWPWSSFHRYVKSRNFKSNWGESVASNVIEMNCGE